jgi:hypothetical protein
MGALLVGFFFGLNSVPANTWWDHLARQVHDFATAGFTAIWLRLP